MRPLPSLAPPFIQNTAHLDGDPLARLTSVDAGHEEVVVVGVSVADRGRNRELNRFRLERSAGRGPADAAASPRAGVAGDRLRPFDRAGGEAPHDLARHLSLEVEIPSGASILVAFAAAPSSLLVRQACRLGELEGFPLDEDSVALVAPPRAGEADDHRR